MTSRYRARRQHRSLVHCRAHCWIESIMFPLLYLIIINLCGALADIDLLEMGPRELACQSQDYPISLLKSTRRKLIAKTICPSRRLTDEEVSADLDPEFLIFNDHVRHVLKPNSSVEQIQAAGFVPTKHTTILIHGWQQSYAVTDWLQKSIQMNKLNLAAEENLIIMDWGKAASSSYGNVVARTSSMGHRLAKFLNILIEQLGVDSEQIHLVGHSLGAHLAAVAVRQFRPKIGQITALDAAGPCFNRILPDEPEPLTRNDAHQVIFYHYNDRSFGFAGAHGHVDIYINGGQSQPGCKVNLKKIVEVASSMVTKKAISTSHTRSTEVASVNLATINCQQVAYECENYDAFRRGECGYCDDHNGQCFLIGLNLQYGRLIGLDRQGLLARPGNKKLYVATNKEDTFCAHHFQVLVNFVTHRDLFGKHKWRVLLELTNEKGRQFHLKIASRSTFNVFTYLLLSDGHEGPSRVTSARLRLLKDGKEALDSLQASTIEINYMSNIDYKYRRALSSQLCRVSNLFSLSNEYHWTAFAECY